MTYTKIAISGKICTGKSTLFNDLQKEIEMACLSNGKIFSRVCCKKTYDP